MAYSSAVSLLLFIFDRDEPHTWPLRRFADCLGIGRVVFLAIYKRLDIRGRDQPDRVAQLANLPASITAAPAGFQCHQAPGLGCKKYHKLTPGDLLAEHDLP